LFTVGIPLLADPPVSHATARHRAALVTDATVGVTIVAYLVNIATSAAAAASYLTTAVLVRT